MGKEQQKTTWLFMVLTAVRKRLGLLHTSFAPIVEQYGIIPFLWEHYELLHYYDNDYIVNDTLRYLGEKGGNIRDLRRAV